MSENAQPRNITIESRKSCEIDISQLFQNGTAYVYPYVEKGGYLFLQFRHSKVILSAGPYVGRIPLTPSLTVEVTPRLPVSNIARVIDIAHGELVNLAAHERPYLADAHSSLSVFEFVAREFAAAIEDVITSGFQKEYVRTSHSGAQLRGKLDVSASIRKWWGSGRVHEVVTTRFEQTANVAINRILRAACELVLGNAIAQGVGGAKHFLRIASFLGQMPGGISPATTKDMEIVHDIIRLKALPSIRDYYYKPLSIAIMALSNNSIDLETEGEDINMSSFLVNFETLFERYLRQILWRRPRHDFWVLDGNDGGQKPLFDDRKNPLAQPDIVVKSKETKKCIVVEVKYKEKPNRDDINQVIAYAVTYRTKDAIIVTQRSLSGKRGLHLVGVVDGINLSQYSFDLNAENLEVEEMDFANFIFKAATHQ